MGVDGAYVYALSSNVRGYDHAVGQSNFYMNALQSLFAVAVLGAGCVGYGGLLLSVFDTRRHIEGRAERLTFSFVLGFGFVGWLLYFPGVLGFFDSAIFWIVGFVGVALFFYRRAFYGGGDVPSAYSVLEIALLTVLAIVLGFDLLEGMSPPSDADTLAYHFALPRDFVVNGEISFVARAVSGAIPMLVHMTYAATVATGGELALTLWVMLTGWATGFLLYAVARRSLSRSWALALLIIFLTTPAVLYGGGGGQVEIRCAGFTLASAVLVAASLRHNSYGLLSLAGICAGYFIGAKFFGLAFAAAAGLFVLCRADGLRRGAIFGAAAVLVGFQWYLWNWIHTGDPVFPILTNALQFPDSAFWTQDFGAYFTALMIRTELPLDRSLTNWLLYPIYATFNLVEALEGGRTGFGIVIALLLPVSIAGLLRRDLRRSDFTIPLLIAFIFFTVWFFSATTQRTRHLLPVYPLVLLGFYPVAVILARQITLARALAVGLGAVITVQLAGQAVFSYNYAKHILSSETRAQFLARNVPGAESADWINHNLPPGAKIAFTNRQLAYLIERPAFTMHPHIQVVIDARESTGDDAQFIRQVRSQDITHLLLLAHRHIVDEVSSETSAFAEMIGRLNASGCLVRQVTIDTTEFSSRTLRQFGNPTRKSSDAVFKVVPEACPADKALSPVKRRDMS